MFFSDCLGRDVTDPAACVLRSGWDIAVTPESESEFEKHALAEGRTVSERKYKHCMNMLTLKKWSLLTRNSHATAPCPAPDSGPSIALLSQKTGPSGMGRAPEAWVSVPNSVKAGSTLIRGRQQHVRLDEETEARTGGDSGNTRCQAREGASRPASKPRSLLSAASEEPGRGAGPGPTPRSSGAD